MQYGGRKHIAANRVRYRKMPRNTRTGAATKKCRMLRTQSKALRSTSMRASYINIHGSGNYIQRAALQHHEVRHVEFNVPVPVDVMIDGEIATLECCSLDMIPTAVDISVSNTQCRVGALCFGSQHSAFFCCSISILCFSIFLDPRKHDWLRRVYQTNRWGKITYLLETGTLRHQQLLGALHGVAVRSVVGSEVGHQNGLMDLRAAREQRGHIGDAHASANIARQIDDAGGVVHLLFGNKIERHDVNGNKQESHADARKRSRRGPPSKNQFAG